jgi:hypothetical protein
MQIKFNTVGTLDFQNVWYVLAFNTSGVAAGGTTGEPYAINGNPQQNWLNYSWEIIIFQPVGTSTPTALVYEFVTTTGVGGGTIKTYYGPLVLTPQQFTLIPNCNGAGTQFCLTFDRTIFSGVLASPVPSSSPSTSPSTSPTASATPIPLSTGAPSTTWYINWFTVSPGSANVPPGQVIDAPGPTGALDQTFLPPNKTYNVSTTFDFPWTAVPPPGWPQVTNQSAQIQGGEVLNAP